MTEEFSKRSDSYTENERILRESAGKLRKIYETQPVIQATREIHKTGWRKWRQRRLDSYGDDSVVTMFPEASDRLHDIVYDAVDRLDKLGVNTKEQLLMLDVGKLKAWSIGGRNTIDTIKVMQDYALAEFHLRWSK